MGSCIRPTLPKHTKRISFFVYVNYMTFRHPGKHEGFPSGLQLTLTYYWSTLFRTSLQHYKSSNIIHDGCNYWHVWD